jgi:hypothetical protein
LEKERGLILQEFNKPIGIQLGDKRFFSIDSASVSLLASRLIFSRAGFRRMTAILLSVYSPSSFLRAVFGRSVTHQGSPGRISGTSSIGAIRGTDRFFFFPIGRRFLKVTNKEFRNWFELLVSGRSLLMAANALYEIGRKKKIKSAGIVVGTYHLEEMYRFLANPRLGVRYATRCINSLERFRGELDTLSGKPLFKRKVLSNISASIEAFQRAKELFEKQCGEGTK